MNLSPEFILLALIQLATVIGGGIGFLLQFSRQARKEDSDKKKTDSDAASNITESAIRLKDEIERVYQGKIKDLEDKYDVVEEKRIRLERELILEIERRRKLELRLVRIERVLADYPEIFDAIKRIEH